MNLGSLAQFPSAFWTRAAAPALFFDEPLRYSRLALPIVVSDIVGVVAAIPVNFPGIIASAAAVVGLDLITFAKAAPAARRPGPGPRSVLLSNQALRDARLSLAVIIGDVVGIVSAVSIYLPGVELAPAAVIGFDLISLAETITASAVGIAAPAVERRDEAGLDARFGLTIILCERLSEKDGKK